MSSEQRGSGQRAKKAGKAKAGASEFEIRNRTKLRPWEQLVVRGQALQQLPPNLAPARNLQQSKHVGHGLTRRERLARR